MKEIQLTKGKVAIVDDEDFDFINQWKWHCWECGYAVRNSKPNPLTGKRSNIFMHRVIMHLDDSRLEIDHKDRNKLNNQKNNLRICTRGDNMKNKPKYNLKKGCTSKFVGVSFNRRDNLWTANISDKDKFKCLGYFKTEEQAIAAREKAVLDSGNEFYHLNDSSL